MPSFYSDSSPCAVLLIPLPENVSPVEVAFTLRGGNIQSNPRIIPRELLALFLDIADALNARVTGEEGEECTHADLRHLETAAELEATEREQSERMEQKLEELEKKWIAEKQKTYTKRVLLVLLLMLSKLGLLLLPFILYRWCKMSKTLPTVQHQSKSQKTWDNPLESRQRNKKVS